MVRDLVTDRVKNIRERDYSSILKYFARLLEFPEYISFRNVYNEVRTLQAERSLNGLIKSNKEIN